ncbi:MAG: hypothetical protein WDM85_18315 [Caulobacteraceae bacterium]
MRGISVIVMSAAVCALLGRLRQEERRGAGDAGRAAGDRPRRGAARLRHPAQLEMVSALPARSHTGDPVAGEGKTAQCRSCHSFVKGGPNLTGPDLYGVIGTKAAAVPGFALLRRPEGLGPDLGRADARQVDREPARGGSRTPR